MPTVTTYPGVFGPYSPITFTRASTGTYFDSAGVLQTAAINEARLDYDPATLAAQGVLIEEARTNSIRNNTMQGASAGVAPTNWTVTWNSTTNGVTITTSAPGTENGIAYIDVAVSGTCTLTGTAHTPAFDTATQIAATVGQTWTESVYLTLVSGSLGDASFNLRLTENDSGGTALTSGDSAAVVPAVGNLRAARFTFTRTLTNASTAFIVPRLRFGFVNGSIYNFTIRIGLPQLENNNISTGVASATVAAGGTGYAVGDVLQIVGGTGTAARLTVATLSGSAVATVTVSTAGSYSVFPSPQPVSVTAITGTGSSATFNIVPQTQTGFATSVIPTTVAQVTRNADVASVNTLSPWYNSTSGTLYAEVGYQQNNPSSAQHAASFNDTTANNRWTTSFTQTSGFGLALRNTSGAGLIQTQTANAATVGATNKIALAISTGASLVLNGGTVATNASYAAPTVTQLELGRQLAAGYFNGYLRRITYYPRRLSDAELQAITA